MPDFTTFFFAAESTLLFVDGLFSFLAFAAVFFGVFALLAAAFPLAALAPAACLADVDGLALFVAFLALVFFAAVFVPPVCARVLLAALEAAVEVLLAVAFLSAVLVSAAFVSAAAVVADLLDRLVAFDLVGVFAFALAFAAIVKPYPSDGTEQNLRRSRFRRWRNVFDSSSIRLRALPVLRLFFARSSPVFRSILVSVLCGSCCWSCCWCLRRTLSQALSQAVCGSFRRARSECAGQKIRARKVPELAVKHYCTAGPECAGESREFWSISAGSAVRHCAASRVAGKK